MGTEGLWRDGDALVLHRDAALPERCVKTGEPAVVTITRKLAWYPPWIGVLLFLGLLGVGIIPFLIVASIFTKRATVRLPIGETLANKRKRLLAAGWALAGLGAVVMIGSIVRGATAGHEIAFVGALPGFLLVLVGYVVGARGNAFVTVSRITDQLVWLRGVDRAFVDGLPDWSVRSGPGRTWEWSLPTGARVLARLDPDGTESVWLGGRLVSRGVAKAEGHAVAIAPEPGGAYRGSGTARVVFAPSLNGCSMEVDGITVAPSPFAVVATPPPARGNVVAAVVATLAVVGGIAGATVFVKSRIARMRPALSTDLALTYASKDGSIVLHYPTQLAAEPIGNAGVKLEQLGGSSLLAMSIPAGPAADLDEVMRVMFDGIRKTGVRVEELGRGMGPCHGEQALLVTATVTDKNDKAKVQACAFRAPSRVFVFASAVLDNRPEDEPIFRAIVETADLPAMTATPAPVASVAPAKRVEVEPVALAACKGEETTCGEDGKSLVQCHNAKPLLVVRSCLGPKGCSTATGEARCDESIARLGDLCPMQSAIACSDDGKMELTCSRDDGDSLTRPPPITKPTSTTTSRSRFLPPPPPPRPVVTKARPPGALVWGKPRTCKTACTVTPDARVMCD